MVKSQASRWLIGLLVFTVWLVSGFGTGWAATGSKATPGSQVTPGSQGSTGIQGKQGIEGGKGKVAKPKPPVKVSAGAAVCMDQVSGKFYFEENPDKPMHPASITKIMTAIVVLECANKGEKVTISPKADLVHMGSTMGLRTGQEIILEDLVKAALIISANDSTVALGMHLTNDLPFFVELMNSKAFLLGLRNTTYVNTNGFSVPGHLTTARDQVLLAKYCLSNEDFAKIVGTKQASITIWKNGKSQPINLYNTNRLLNGYPGVKGVKTGTTIRAGNCLLAAANRNGRQLITIVLKSRDRYQDTIRLMEYGFKAP